MREARKTSATCAGTITFIAQVRSSRPLEPNLRPAMNTTFSIFGRRSISPRSSKSQAMHSTPQASSFSRSPGSVKRATPTTRLPGAARLARRARVGPILPPTPRTRISPESRFSSAPSSGEGVVMTSSSWATSAMRSGSFTTKPALRFQARRFSPTLTIFIVLVPPALPMGSPMVSTIRSPFCTRPARNSTPSASSSSSSRSRPAWVTISG